MSTGTKYPYCSPELWGGIECTINRVGNDFRDQLDMSNHYSRQGDLEHFAKLGIRKIRYPVLWEKHEPREGCETDWTWTSAQLQKLHDLNIEPIVGMLHHGSGPSFTNLGDPAFPEKFAKYASRVATRFPRVKYYTPINEPLTTARFSGLYGYWYPHHADEQNFLRILLHQLKAIVLAMAAIREVSPGAMLVQTEDLCKVHSTEVMKYQADFENHRRWLTNDILLGKVNPSHFFWDYFLAKGVPAADLQFFIDHPCPPSIMGFNYYVTSERYLDENVEHYPLCKAGGNGIHMYVDTEAVRCGHSAGLAPMLREAWHRYGIPLAVTECHLSCSRDEQLRWFMECFETCRTLNTEGVEVKAITAWSLLGAFDWNSLLTQDNKHYESGVFDISNKGVRPTALATMISSLSHLGEYSHPVLSGKGWWHGQEKIAKSYSGQKPLMIIGKTGTLANAFARICSQRGIATVSLAREEICITDETSIKASIEKYRPWAVINATGYVRVDEAEDHVEECYAVNTIAPALIAKVCGEKGLPFMSFSSDLVFDGSKRTPYLEDDKVLPLNVYGSSKAEGEKKILGINPDALVIRTSAFFGPWDSHNFVYAVTKSVHHQAELFLPSDVIVSPTYVPDLCHTALDLFIDGEKGIWHLSNDCKASWYELATIIVKRINQTPANIVSKTLSEMGWKAKRPMYSVLQSDKGVTLPGFEHALDRYFSDCSFKF